MPAEADDRNGRQGKRARRGTLTGSLPWRDRGRLNRWLADWRVTYHGRPLHGLRAGAGWVSVQLLGDERASLFLGALPGAVILFPYSAPLPTTLRKALPSTRRHALLGLLKEAKITGAALLTDDLVLQLTFATKSGPRFLRHQLFGSRGGTVLLGADGRLLWSAYPSPHPSLLDPAAQVAGPDAPFDDHTSQHHDASWSQIGQQHLARQLEVSLGDRLQQTTLRRLSASSRLIDNLSADLARADSSQRLREDAETLAAHLHQVERGADSITCLSPHDGSKRTISLDPALPASANLERLFRLARKAQRGRQIIADRLDDARTQERNLLQVSENLAFLLRDPGLAESSAADTEVDQLDRRLARLDSLLTLAEQCREILQEPRSGSPRRSPEEPARPFRRYKIHGKWEVWIGRNSRENDLLTHEMSHPRDIWLHAQSVEGSHVVLRACGKPQAVPRLVVELAAALAAMFSKARHSSLVPVIWTERRYVRRPRGAASGAAVCLRAESLFVAPGIQDGVEPS